MGSGIAQTLAQHGYRVLLSDIDLAAAEKGRAGIDKALGKLVGRGKLDIAGAEAALARIEPVADLAPMAEASFIIEAATEHEEIKQAIFERAGKVLGSDAIMASNTSSIPITRMATGSPDPARFIGLHFFNPVPVMGLIEVIPGLATAPDTIARTRALRREPGQAGGRSAGRARLRRQPHPRADAQRGGLRAGAGHREHRRYRQGLPHRPQPPDGPARAGRFRRARHLLDIVRVLYTTTGDSKYRPAPAADEIRRGRLARPQDRQGFYDYTGEVPVPTR